MRRAGNARHAPTGGAPTVRQDSAPAATFTRQGGGPGPGA